MPAFLGHYRYSAFGRELILYNPEIGRWLTPDPEGFTDGPNLYAYVHNNPLTHLDPYGLASEPNDWKNNPWAQSACGMLHYVAKEAFTIASDLNFGDRNKQQAFLDKLPGNREHHLFQYFSTPYHNPKLQGGYIPFPNPTGVKQFADLTRKVYSTFLPVAQKANSSARRIFQSVKNSYQHATSNKSFITKNNQTNRGAFSVNASVNLSKKLSQLETQQQNYAKIRLLQDGRIRYYTPEQFAHKKGPTRGSSYTTEFDLKSGRVRTWMECYDQNGKINRVHPKQINRQEVSSPHYPPTAKELGIYE